MVTAAVVEVGAALRSKSTQGLRAVTPNTKGLLQQVQQCGRKKKISSATRGAAGSLFRRRPLHSTTKTAKSTTAPPPSVVTTNNKAATDALVSTKFEISCLNKMLRSCGLGFVAGNMGALTGMGGGFLMVPLLCSPRVAALGQHYAHGTSSFAVAATGLAGAIGYNMAKKSDGTNDEESDGRSTSANVEYAIAIATTGMFSARFGASITATLSAKTLKRLLGVFMLSVAPIVPLKSYLAEMYGNDTNKPKEAKGETPLYEKIIPPAFIGLGSGFLMGVFGVGGGAVVVPALTIFTDLNHYQALSTSLCSMVLPSMMSSATHFQKGNLLLKIGGPLSMGAFMGAYFGSRYLAPHCSEEKLRYGFAGIMALLGTRALLF